MVLMVSSSDHIAGVAGATLTITASKAGAAFAGIEPTVVDRGSGWYSVALTAAMLDTLGDYAIHATAAGCDPADALLEVVAYDPGDAAALGLSRLDAAISTRSTLAAGAQMALIDDAITAAKIAAGAIGSSEAPALANLDAAVSTRLASAGYTAPANSDVAAIKAKTDALPADPADQSLITAATDSILSAVGVVDGVADAILLDTAAIDARLPSDPADESSVLAAIATRAAPGDAMALSSAAVDGILDEPVEGAVTLRQAMRVLLAVLAGKASGAPSGPIVYRDVNDTADRVTGTIDTNGNRSAVTLNV